MKPDICEGRITWAFKLMLLNCGAEEDSWESLGPKGDQTSQSWRKTALFIGSTDAKAEAPILWPPDAKRSLIGKDPDAGEDWRQKEKGGNKGWDGWMASLTQWTWVWTHSWRQAWQTAGHGVTKSLIWLSNWTTRTTLHGRYMICDLSNPQRTS